MELRLLERGRNLRFLLDKVELDRVADTELSRKIKTALQEGQQLAEGKYTTVRYVVDLSDTEMESVVEALACTLASLGVGDNGELNALGRRVESPIDLFRQHIELRMPDG